MDNLRDCETVLIPPRTLKESTESYQSDSDEDTEIEHISEPTLGGKLSPTDALSTLLKFASALRDQGRISPEHILFEYQPVASSSGRNNQFVCRVSLPNTSIHGISGSPEASKQLARRSAAFSACKRLSFLGLLEYWMVPIPPAPPPSEENPSDPKDAGTRRYVRRSPMFWTNGNSGPVTVLYSTIIRIEPSDGHNFASLLILTRKPLPSMTSFDLFPLGRRAKVQLYRGGSFNPDEEEMNILYGFNLRLLKIAVNKPATCPVDDMNYFFGALAKSWRPSGGPNEFELPEIVGDIDWKLMSLISEKWAVPIEDPSASDFDEKMADVVIQDRWLEFTRRYYLSKVRHDLTPMSKPEDSQVRYHFYPHIDI